MIFKSITLENFLSYYGTQNNIDFADGSTIIIGQNKSGKSKLFDAFNWVLYNKAYNTDKEIWEYTPNWKENIVNNLAKKECIKENSVNTSVSLKFMAENNEEYFLTREYIITKVGSNKWDCPTNSELSLTRTDKRSNDHYSSGKEAEDLIKGFFPENLSKYFFFQGENISQIMKLNSRSDFTKALKELSRIEIFDNAKHYASKLYKTISNEFQSKDDKDKVIQRRKTELSEEIDNISKTIIKLEEDKENDVKERDLAKDISDKKNNELKKYEECEKLIQEIELLKKDLEISQDKLFNAYEIQRKDIFTTWMYIGTENLFKNFIIYYLKNKKEKKIPEPISQELIIEMINQQKCFICNRKALKGTTEHTHILSFKNEKALDKQIEYIMSLYTIAENSNNRIKNIPNEIRNFYEKINSLNNKISEIIKRIKVKDKELDDVLPKGIKKNELETRKFKDLKEAKNNANNDYINYDGKVRHLVGKIEAKREEFKRREKEYNTIIENSSNELEKEKMKVVEKLRNLTVKMHDQFLQKLYKNIEDEANKHYQDMTRRNPALSGKVKIDYEDEEIYTVDENEVRLLNINQANKVSLQISFVAAILSVSNKFWETYYPFIADAPISALGGNNKLNAIETMIDTFSQSIIILKDDAILGNKDSVKEDPVRKLILNNNNIINSYELVTVGNSIEEQITTIKKFK